MRSRDERYNQPEDAERRKPSGRMIIEAIDAHEDAAYDGVLYVGDRSEDERAALDADVSFEWATDFFGA